MPSNNPNNNKLFVGGLAWEADESDVRDVFEQFGTVLEVAIPKHREGEHAGESRGFAFVTMSTADSAARAKNSIDGSDICGRRVVVREAQAP